ncbi:MAG: HRDC domain-containing protein, partial [Bacteroidales bacterium]|nr:HRDC domain-containing protein [Bacteroidales bacterium]
GEEYPQDNCGSCDNCLNPKPTFDGRKEMCRVIELILSMPENFKMEHLANILTGKQNAAITSYHHDQLPLFGSGKDHTEKFWCTVIHQGLILHLLDKGIETYGLISVTDKGKEFFEHPTALQLVEDRIFPDGVSEEEDDDDGAAASLKAGGGGGDMTLLSMLKDLRKDMGRRLKLQPWIIFGDPALEDMSILYPITYDELKNCQGVGEGKARKFGAEFIALIKKYVEENDITRPDDFVMKSSPSKSENKVYIIKSVDRQLPLEDIAEARGLEMDELMSEIEAIVATGTKLNLDYYIRQEVDDEVVEEILDYFKEEATSDSLQDAIAALEPDCEEMEIRLARIKFLCEIAS